MWRDGEAEQMTASASRFFHRFEADLQHVRRIGSENVFEKSGQEGAPMRQTTTLEPRF
jgi:hypothetical protein